MAISHEQLCAVVDEIADAGEQRGEYAIGRFDFGDDLRVVTFRRPQGYSMLKLSRSDQENIGTFIQIAGGGAVNAPASSDLCRSILERHVSIDWGGPFVQAWPSGSMTYGTQMVLPSILFGADDAASFTFLLGMIDIFGEIARSIAVELVPRYGGDLLNGSDSSHEIDLYTALVGLPPPGVDFSGPADTP